MSANGAARKHYDVVIIGTGLAGLSLARQLLLYTGKSILLLDKRVNPPREASQKYGESLVQAAGYYFSRVLDLEEHLLIHHHLKYNLRFHWATEGRENRKLADYSQSYIRKLSNIATFHLDRNRFEEFLLESNTATERCDFIGGARNSGADISETGGDHRVYWDGGETQCRWVVDATGRGQAFKRKLGLAAKNSVRHGSTFFWVEGYLNVEKLDGRPHQEYLYDRQRQKTGQFPFFLATNHFMAEGQWFWLIPLHNKTSIGLVYDHAVINPEDVSNTSKLIDYACRKWPILARELPHRKVLDEGRLIDFSYDCQQTISPQRWALVGEAGRFSDPLYSPGSDLIAIYNTLVADAIQAEETELEDKCRLAEQIQRVMYESYLPSYALSYDCLGDQETHNLKYTWELAVYFGFFVLPMINGLFANAEFMKPFLKRFAILGPINYNLQRTLSAFFQWKKKQPPVASPVPRLFEFYNIQPLFEAETLFYEVGLTPAEAVDVVDRHIERLKEFARYIIAHIHASVLGNREVLTNGPFVASLKLRNTVFGAEQMRAAYAPYSESKEMYKWNLNPMALEDFLGERRAVPMDSAMAAK